MESLNIIKNHFPKLKFPYLYIKVINWLKLASIDPATNRYIKKII